VRDRAWDWFRDDYMSRIEPGLVDDREHDPLARGRHHRPTAARSARAQLDPHRAPSGDRPRWQRRRRTIDSDARALWPEVYDARSARQRSACAASTAGGRSISRSRFPRAARCSSARGSRRRQRARRRGRVVRGWDLAATHEGDGAATCGVKIREVAGRSSTSKTCVWLRGSPYEVEKLIVETAARADGSR
jgi:hypothetical protein